MYINISPPAILENIFICRTTILLSLGLWKESFSNRPVQKANVLSIKKDEGVKALIGYAGGLNAEALASGMKVLRTENERQVQRDVNANAILKIADQDYPLFDGDIVKVDLIKPGLSNKIELRGEVTYPDVYELRNGDRLFDIINRAGGVTRNTYLPRAYIFRGAGDSTNLKSDRLEVDLSDINVNNMNSFNNVLLLPNDVIQLFSQGEFGEQHM